MPNPLLPLLRHPLRKIHAVLIFSTTASSEKTAQSMQLLLLCCPSNLVALAYHTSLHIGVWKVCLFLLSVLPPHPAHFYLFLLHLTLQQCSPGCDPVKGFAKGFLGDAGRLICVVPLVIPSLTFQSEILKLVCMSIYEKQALWGKPSPF